MPEFLSVKEVADLLRLSERTIITYIRSGKIPAANAGRTYRIRKSDIDALFIKREKEESCHTLCEYRQN